MLVKPSIEALLPKVDNRYTLTLLIAKRARQLVSGGQPLVRSESPNVVTIACEELDEDRLAAIRGEVQVHVPLRPEVAAARLAALNQNHDDDLLELEDEFASSRARARAAVSADAAGAAPDESAGEVETMEDLLDPDEAVAVAYAEEISDSEDLSVMEAALEADEPAEEMEVDEA